VFYQDVRGKKDESRKSKPRNFFSPLLSLFLSLSLSTNQANMAEASDELEVSLIPKTRELLYLIASYNIEIVCQLEPVDQAEVVWRWCQLRMEPDQAHKLVALLARSDYSWDLCSMIEDYPALRSITERRFDVIERLIHMHLASVLFPYDLGGNEVDDEDTFNIHFGRTLRVEWCIRHRNALDKIFATAAMAASSAIARQYLVEELLRLCVPFELMQTCRTPMSAAIEYALDQEFPALQAWQQQQQQQEPTPLLASSSS
jgi:hypothetical protein